MPTRLRFVLGEKAVDVALPGDVQLVDLLPSVLSQFGAEWVEQSVDHEGWVAQRLGEPPMPEDKSFTELNLVDGETVYLLPRSAEMAALDYDDLVDGVAERVRADAGQWTPVRTRWMLRAATGVALFSGLGALLAGAGAPSLWVLPVSLAVVLLVCAAAVSRALGAVVDGTLLAGVGVIYAGTGGWLGAMAIDPPGGPEVWSVLAGVAVVAAIVLSLVAVADAAQIFGGALVFVILLLIPGVIWAASSHSAAHAAAIGITVNLVLSLFVAGTAFRLGGLKLPMLPTDAAEVREDIDPVPHRVVIERSVVVFGYLKAMYVGYGLAQTVLLVTLVLPKGKWEMIMAAVVAALLLLRSRHLSGLLPRWSLLVPACAAVVAILLRQAIGEPLLFRVLVVLVPLLVAGAGLAVLSRYLPKARLRPYWGRAVDILEYLSAIAVIPLLLAVLDVYAAIRGLSG
ncbi:type VII secretion integral membrane protein EccD [Amycolatopsis sp. NPDC059657]|uniref:type VII secretion integral membrane protein EccD n=1 Tax=Amycolatopsis sp. NPDC059657 TaxID=3346899 RepID=UPI0036706D45